MQNDKEETNERQVASTQSGRDNDIEETKPKRPSGPGVREKDVRVRDLDQNEKVEGAGTKVPKELRRRNFKIIKCLLEKHGYYINCMGCEAIVSDDVQR